jgi:ribose 5-phosphate isomerase B
MRVHLGSDHAGYELKARLVTWLEGQDHDVVDHGPHVYDPTDDYPTFCLRTAEATAADPASLGVVIGGSGNGEQMAANKVKGVRAALAWSDETASLARRHNDANVVAIGARMHTMDQVVRMVEVFLATPYSQDDRHARRIAMLRHYEESGALPPLPGT